MMFDSLNKDVLREICLINEGGIRENRHDQLFDFLECFRTAANECRSSPEATNMNEVELQQVERGLLAAQRITSHAFRK